MATTVTSQANAVVAATLQASDPNYRKASAAGSLADIVVQGLLRAGLLKETE